MLSKIISESKIVFFDLDNTLFDNLKIRHDAIVPALKRLDLKRSIKELLEKYEQIVDLSDTLEFIGLTNFKHIWNRSELYAILAILFTDNESQRKAFGVTRSEQNLFLDKFNPSLTLAANSINNNRQLSHAKVVSCTTFSIFPKIYHYSHHKLNFN